MNTNEWRLEVTQTQVLEWAQPTDISETRSSARQINYPDLLAELRTKRGKWALVKEYPAPAEVDSFDMDRRAALSSASFMRTKKGLEAQVGPTRSGLLGVFARLK